MLNQSNDLNERKEEEMSPEELEDYLKDSATAKVVNRLMGNSIEDGCGSY